MFSESALENAAVASNLGKYISTLPHEEKLALLEGESKLTLGILLHKILKQEPRYWKALQPGWIGENNSLIRRASSALGWQSSMLPDMLRQSWMTDSDTWIKVLRYPYSLVIAVDTLAKIKHQKARDNGAIEFLVLAHPVVGSMPTPVKVALDAEPHDVAMAEIILQRLPLQHISFQRNMDSIDLPASKRIQLETMIDMHLSLDCLNLLVDALSNDRIPGAVLDNTVCLALPQMD